MPKQQEQLQLLQSDKPSFFKNVFLLCFLSFIKNPIRLGYILNEYGFKLFIGITNLDSKIMMNSFYSNLVVAVVLIALSLWSYYSSESPSVTALIPTFASVVLLALSVGLYRQNSTVLIALIVLYILLIVAMVKPLTGAVSRESTIGIVRVVIMMLSLSASTVISIIDLRALKA